MGGAIARKRDKPEQIVVRLRQVDLLTCKSL